VKRIGVKEFDDWISKVRDEQPIAVERNGRLIGFYVPVGQHMAPDREAALEEALERLETAIERVLEQTGMTEDELADLFDLSKPLPMNEPDLPKRTPASQLG
jgi:hypothetical protein